MAKIREVTVSMKDFELGGEAGDCINKEDRRKFVMMHNAKASMIGKACKALRKEAPHNKQAEEYIDKINQVIKDNAIPLDVYVDQFNNRIKDSESKRAKLLSIRQKNRGFLSKGDKAKLEELEVRIQELKLEKDAFIKDYKKEEQFDLVKKGKKNESTENINEETTETIK